MNQVVYINGQYCQAHEAKISIFDRGLLFADSVYEVIPVYSGRLFFADKHIKRLEQSLDSARIPRPNLNWYPLFNRLIDENGGGDLQIYLQITRGNEGKRRHDLPTQLTPTILAFTLHTPYPKQEEKIKGLKVKLVEDIRWHRCDIKTTSLLGHILVNDDAVSAGFNTAILQRGDRLTGGSSSNVFLVDKKGVIHTPPLNNDCLAGITRQITIDLIRQLNLPFAEGIVPIQLLFDAQEIWITSTSKEIYPVTQLNQQKVGQGVAGPVWQQLNNLYQQLILKSHE